MATEQASRSRRREAGFSEDIFKSPWNCERAGKAPCNRKKNFLFELSTSSGPKNRLPRHNYWKNKEINFDHELESGMIRKKRIPFDRMVG
jgi:hypothetical protein